jgi:signal transduction histidine kinase
MAKGAGDGSSARNVAASSSRVRISGVSPKYETIVPKVEDSGPGITPGLDAFQLFETTKANGTGLGLAIARQIIAAHGGTIVYDSVEPHRTMFTIRLPSSGPSLR